MTRKIRSPRKAREVDESAFDFSKLTLSHSLSLLFVAALAIASTLLSVSITHHQEGAGTLINLSGKQRMLSQRVAFLANELVIVPRDEVKDTRRELRIAAEQMRATHYDLIYGNHDRNIPPLTSDDLRRVYFEPPARLDQRMHGYLDRVASLLDTPDERLVTDHPDLYAIDHKDAVDILPLLERVVSLHERETERNLKRLEWVQKTILFFMLVGLTVIWRFIYRPLTNKYAQQAELFQREKEKALSARARLDRALKGSNDGLWEWFVGTDKVYYSQRFIQLLGYSSSSDFPHVLDSLKTAIHPDERDAVMAELEGHLESDEPYDVTYRLACRDGEYRWFRAKGQCVREEGKAVLMSGTLSDVTEMVSLQKVIDETNRLLEVTFDTIEQGVVVYDSQLCLLTWSKGYERIMDFPEGWLQRGRSLEDYFRLNAERGEYGEKAPDEIEAAIETRMKELRVDLENIEPHRYIRRRPDGRSIEIIGRPMPGGGLVATYTDITRQEEAKAEIEKLAWTDPLTGLLNRNAMRSAVLKSLQDAQVAQQKLAIILIDLDRFKPINDTYGHAAGDYVLKITAQRIQEACAPTDRAFRLGGDEFALAHHFASDDKSVYAFIERLLEEVRKPIEFEGRDVAVGASIGASFYPDHDKNADELIRKADTALYEAKSVRRGGYRGYDALVDHKAQTLRRVEDELTGVLERGELELYFQPKVCAVRNKINGAEALVRWNHPDRGLQSPAEFIPVIERSDLVFPIGAWIMRDAWKHAYKWVDAYEGRTFAVAVNVSSRQFFDSGFIALLEELVRTQPNLARSVELEITEEVMIENIDEAIDIIANISEMGYSVTIDDFGTGYSSISYLHKLPVQKIKIDKSFLDSLQTNSQSASIIQSIIDLGHNLGVKVVAEGVETIDQIKFLRESFCDEYQGYYFGAPMRAADFEELMREDMEGKGHLALTG